MTAKQYRDAIAKLGMSQRFAAKVLGFHERTSRTYASGDSKVPEPVARLLRLMIRLGVKPEEIE